MVPSSQSELARLAERHGTRLRFIGPGDGDSYAESPLWVEAGVFHHAESLLFETCEQLLALDSDVAVVRVGDDQAALYVRGELDGPEVVPPSGEEADPLEEDDSEVSFDGIDAPSLVGDLGVALSEVTPPPVVQLVVPPSPAPVVEARRVLVTSDGKAGPRCRIGSLVEASLPSQRVDRLALAGAREAVDSIEVQTSRALRAYHVEQFGSGGGVLYLFSEPDPARSELAVATLTLRLDAEGGLLDARLVRRRPRAPARPAPVSGRARRSDTGVFSLMVLLALLVAAIGVWQGADWTEESPSPGRDVVASALLAQPAPPPVSSLAISDLQGEVLRDPVLNDAIPALSRCHEHAVRTGDVALTELEGTLRLRYTVTADGYLEQVSLGSRTLVSEVADSCFETVLLTLRYPSDAQPGERAAVLSLTVPSD